MLQLQQLGMRFVRFRGSENAICTASLLSSTLQVTVKGENIHVRQQESMKNASMMSRGHVSMHSNRSISLMSGAAMQKPAGGAGAGGATGASAMFPNVPAPVSKVKPIEIDESNLINYKFKGNNQRKQWIANNFFTIMNNTKVVAVYHYNGMSTQDWTDLRVKLKGNGFNCTMLSVSVLRRALRNTPFKAMEPLFWGPAVLVYSAQNDLAQLFQAFPTIPNLEFLGAKVDKHLLAKDDLAAFFAMPPIATFHSELVGILSGPAASLASTLEQNQQLLLRALNTYSNLEKKENEEEGAKN